MNAGSRSLAARPSLGPLALFILALLASACSARRAAGHGRHGVASLAHDDYHTRIDLPGFGKWQHHHREL